MTVILPADRGPAPGASPDGRAPDGIGLRDFGATLVRPIDAVRQAADACLVDCSLHDATRALGALADDLTATEPDIDSWPDRFAAAARRVRDDFAARIPDGPPRDRFDAGFDLFAKAKAVETRALATHKRIAFNRAELDRALAGYGDAISRATNPVAAEFALTQGETAIRNQVAAKVLSEEQGAALSQRFRDNIALRRVRQFTEDDPAAAAQELAKDAGGLFSDLDPGHRVRLAEQARQIAGARDADTARAAESDSRRQAVATALHRDAFLRDLDDRAQDGRATLADIAAAAQDGILDPAEAASRMEILGRTLDDRRRAADRVARLLPQPGVFLNPADAADRRAADIHWRDVVLPLVDGLPEPERARLEDAVVLNTGIAPKPAVDGVLAGLLSPDPESRVGAARRIDRWLLSQPPIPVDRNGLRVGGFDALRPYLDIPIPDARKIELAENAVMRRAPGEAPPRPVPLPAGTDGGSSGHSGTDGDAGRGLEIDEKLSDPAARATLRDSLLDALREEAAQSGMSPQEMLESQQEIRDALPADPSRGVDVAVVPAVAAAGAAIAPESVAAGLAAVGLGGLLLSLRGDSSDAGESTEGRVVRRTEDDDGGDRAGEEQPAADTPADGPDHTGDGKRSGRKADDSSKNERHGDGGRAERELRKRLEEENAIEAARKLPRKERSKVLKKIQNRRKDAERQKRGTEHSRRGKGKR